MTILSNPLKQSRNTSSHDLIDVRVFTTKMSFIWTDTEYFADLSLLNLRSLAHSISAVPHTENQTDYEQIQQY